MIHENDLPRWRAKFEQIEAAAALDEEYVATRDHEERLRGERDAELRAIIDELVESLDFASFRQAMDSWARRPGPYLPFKGFPQMWINQVSHAVADGNTAAVAAMAQAVLPPDTVADSVAKMVDLQAATTTMTKPQPGRIPTVLSVYWSSANVRTSWPTMWPSGPEQLRRLGWLRPWNNYDVWPHFVEIARAMYPQDSRQVARPLWFLKNNPFVGLNPFLREMCVEAAQLMSGYDRGSGYPDAVTAERAESLARQLKGEAALAGSGLAAALSDRTGLELKSANIEHRIAFDKSAAYRADTYTLWTMTDEAYAPSFRLWATRSGLAFGVHAYGGSGRNDTRGAAARVASDLPGDVSYFAVRPHLSGDRLRPVPTYESGELFVGKWWTWDEAPQGLALREVILDLAEEYLPVFQVIHAPSKQSPALEDSEGSSADEPLSAYKDRFVAERPYPTEKDIWHREERARFAQSLSSSNLSVFDLDVFRQVINGPRYGGAGPQSILNTSLRAMDSIALDAFAANLREILWGDESIERRIDRALDWDDLGTKGLGESVIMKMLSITDPERILPVFPLTGPMGKIALLRKLDLPEPSEELSRGERHLSANNALRERLEPLFPGDLWGQAQFGYWLLHQEEVHPPEVDRLTEVASDLHVQEEFLREVEELLLDKGQVVFYGPPGTGKTYIADRFAAAIQPDSDRRMLVQFHPSMSYEDFFEGYRPNLDDGGAMSYELRPGPLAIMARKAEAAPGVPHVMIIDEINRANLPRVFGELLYLLEYRKKWVRTAYRADEPFELPANLYFIGTMNTADRSIAMIDAALRRRFHFIPFVPHEGPLAGVLRKWLKEKGEPAWIANMVDRVNEQLAALLRGPHLLIGHSHFMVGGADASKPAVLTDERLRRIWDYGIYPLIEDQLHSKPERLKEFTWAAVLKAYGPGTESALEADVDTDDIDDGDGASLG